MEPNQNPYQFKILLVDDDQDFVETLAARLMTRGFQAATALDGDAAIAQVREQEFDVVILDVVMPGKDGIETLQELKRLSPLTEVIMLSGHASLEIAIRGMRFGAFDFLTKPSDMADLVDKINKAHGRKADHEERIRQADFVRNQMTETGTTATERESAAVAETPSGHGRMLVIGRESDFPRKLIEYALVVAKQMSFEIIAVNAAGFDNESFKLFPAARERVCQEFREISEKNAVLFRQAAQKSGIVFSHMVKCCEQDEAIAEIRKQIGEIDYVVCEEDGPDQSRGRDRIVTYAPV